MVHILFKVLDFFIKGKYVVRIFSPFIDVSVLNVTCFLVSITLMFFLLISVPEGTLLSATDYYENLCRKNNMSHDTRKAVSEENLTNGIDSPPPRW
jgi:hypothetical protein